jgi:hypothetical protein
MKRRRRRPPKDEALRVHSFRRALERYPELDLTDEVRAEIITAIREGKSSPVERQSNRVSVHDVTLKSGHVVRVVYDRQRGRLITFLYKDDKDYAILKAGPGLYYCPACEYEKKLA